MGFIEAFWGWIFGSTEPKSGAYHNNGGLKEMSELQCGTFIKHRDYVFSEQYEEMIRLQSQWEGAYHAYTNAVIDGDQEQLQDLWVCMGEIDQDAAVMIEKIEEYLEQEQAA
jgi:hypothetical protein